MTLSRDVFSVCATFWLVVLSSVVENKREQDGWWTSVVGVLGTKAFVVEQVANSKARAAMPPYLGPIIMKRTSLESR